MDLVVLLSGKAGSGKTTVADMLVGSTKNIDYIPFSEKYYEDRHGRSFDDLLHVFEQVIGVTTINKKTIPVSNWSSDRRTVSGIIHIRAVELSEPIKQLSHTMTKIPYEVLLGEGLNRVKRDDNCYYSTVTNEHITGRQVLIKYGTDGFRKLIDEDYWIKLAASAMLTSSIQPTSSSFLVVDESTSTPTIDISKLSNVRNITVVSDTRFINEIDTFREVTSRYLNSNTKVIHIIIARDEKELQDQSGHISEWEYLYRKEDACVIMNNGSIPDLAIKISAVLAVFAKSEGRTRTGRTPTL